MEVYVFTSQTITNIYAGVGARTWAVSEVIANKQQKATQAQALRIGSMGLLYCSETHELTTPFIVESRPDVNAPVGNIWPPPDVWHFPFRITPLGSPARRLSNTQLALLPSVATSGRQWHNILFIRSDFAFQPSTISDEDWEYLYTNLQHA